MSLERVICVYYLFVFDKFYRWHFKLLVGDEPDCSRPRRQWEYARKCKETITWVDDGVSICRQLCWLVFYCDPQKGYFLHFLLGLKILL